MRLICCAAALCVSFFAYLFPQLNWNHTALYAGILAGFCIILGRWLWLSVGDRRRVGRDYALIWALGGTLLAVCCALISGLIDPDVLILRGSPGALLGIPETTARVGFAGRQSMGKHPDSLSLSLELQPAERLELLVGQHHLLGSFLLTIGHEVSASVQARDVVGSSLTITHPSSGAFLAPLFLFHREQNIGALVLPFDEISIPAKNEHLAAFYIDDAAAKTTRLARVSGGRSGVLIDVATSDGHPLGHGIGFVPDGVETQLADLRLLISLGQYPTLYVTPVPQPALMFGGFFAFVGGCSRLITRRRPVPKVIVDAGG